MARSALRSRRAIDSTFAVGTAGAGPGGGRRDFGTWRSRDPPVDLTFRITNRTASVFGWQELVVQARWMTAAILLASWIDQIDEDATLGGPDLHPRQWLGPLERECFDSMHASFFSRRVSMSSFDVEDPAGAKRESSELEALPRQLHQCSLLATELMRCWPRPCGHDRASNASEYRCSHASSA